MKIPHTFKYIATQSITISALVISTIALLCCYNHQLKIALLIGLIAFFLDIIDGPIARHLKTNSSRGAQLDLLVDFTCFILFPVFFILQIYQFPSPLLYILLTTFTIAGAFRLTRNTDEGFIHHANKTYYRGLPSVFSHALLILVYLCNQTQSPTVTNILILTGLLTLTISMPATFLFPKPQVRVPLLVVSSITIISVIVAV